jgi:hypothetical protein
MATDTASNKGSPQMDDETIVQKITGCVNNFSHKNVNEQIVNELDGQEIDTLLFDDQVRFRGRFSAVPHIDLEKTNYERMLSAFQRRTRPDCNAIPAAFRTDFQAEINKLIDNVKNDAAASKSFYRRALAFFKSKKNRTDPIITLTQLQTQLNNKIYENISFPVGVVDALDKTQYEEMVDKMCSSMIYLNNIILNKNKISIKRLISFLSHLFHALAVGGETAQDKIKTLSRIQSYLKRMVQSYRNISLIEAVESEPYTFAQPIDPTDLFGDPLYSILGTGRKGKKGSRRHPHSAKKTRHVVQKGHSGRKTHRR